MSTVLILLSVLGGLMFWRTGRFGAIWDAAIGAKSI